MCRPLRLEFPFTKPDPYNTMAVNKCIPQLPFEAFCNTTQMAMTIIGNWQTNLAKYIITPKAWHNLHCSIYCDVCIIQKIVCHSFRLDFWIPAHGVE